MELKTKMQTEAAENENGTKTGNYLYVNSKLQRT